MNEPAKCPDVAGEDIDPRRQRETCEHVAAIGNGKGTGKCRDCTDPTRRTRENEYLRGRSPHRTLWEDEAITKTILETRRKLKQVEEKQNPRPFRAELVVNGDGYDLFIDNDYQGHIYKASNGAVSLNVYPGKNVVIVKPKATIESVDHLQGPALDECLDRHNTTELP